MTALDVALVAQNVVRQDGQGRVMLELCRALLDRGHRVTVYASRVAEDLEDRIELQRIPRQRRFAPFADLAFLVRATARLRRRSHDVVCTMGPCALPRQPLVYYAQFSQRGWRDTWAHGGRPSPYHRAHSVGGLALESLVLRRARHVIACSRAVARELGLDGVDVTVVPNGIDPAEVPPLDPERRAALRARFGLPGDAWVVGFLGEYGTPRKGLDTLIRAVGAGRPDEHLLAGGRGRQRAARATAGDAGLGERLVLAGFADPAAVIGAADVMAVPSRYEPFSLVALEALAAGVPLVLSDRAGAAEVLDGAAVVVPPDDVAALSGALDEVRDRPDLRDALAAAGPQRIAALSWSRVAGSAAAVVEAVAGNGPAEPST